MNELPAADRVTLESLIDKADLSAVLRALALACVEKSEHLQVNWQDQPAAQRWERAHTALMRASEFLPIRNVSA